MPDLKKHAELLHMLAHPTRLEVLDRLRQGAICVEHMRQEVGVSQPNLSQHLTLMRLHGVVGYYERGRRRCYYLLKPALVDSLFAFLHGEYPVCDTPPPTVCELSA